MEKVFITDQELEALKKLHHDMNEATLVLGMLEIQMNELQSLKNEAFQRIATIKENQDSFGKQLSQTYGDGSIDLKTKEFIKGTQK